MADEIGWLNLSPSEKSKHYEAWTRTPEIGGVVGRFMDSGKVRVYIKDTLLKDYTGHRLADEMAPLRALGFSSPFPEAEETYVKPHGRRLSDGRIVCWGRAEDWKSILMALHERAYVRESARPFAAALLHGDGRFRETHTRKMIEVAAHKLSIEKVVWLDN
jgi:hypothetical protein